MSIGERIKNNKGKIIGMAVAVIYILSHIDAIPDVIQLLGLLDDAGALGTFIGLAIAVMKKKKEKEGGQVKDAEIVEEK